MHLYQNFKNLFEYIIYIYISSKSYIRILDKIRIEIIAPIRIMKPIIIEII